MYLSYLDKLKLFCIYYACCKNHITIIGGDFNVDINNNCFSAKGRYFDDYLNERNMCPVPVRQSLTCNGPLYIYRSKSYNVKILIDYICVPECIE